MTQKPLLANLLFAAGLVLAVVVIGFNLHRPAEVGLEIIDCEIVLPEEPNTSSLDCNVPDWEVCEKEN